VTWTERDLDLFKSRRQRGTRLPPPKEINLHASIVGILNRWCSTDWRWTHVGHGFAYASAATGARAKRMGVKPGWPDFQFFHCRGACCFIELKRSGGVVSEAQQDIAFHLMRARHGYLLTDSFADALNALRDWGIVPSAITVGRSGGAMEGHHAKASKPSSSSFKRGAAS